MLNIKLGSIVAISFILAFGCLASDKYEEYLETGNITSELTIEATQYQCDLDNFKQHTNQFDWISEIQKKVYQNILSDLDNIKLLLAKIEGNPKEDCPYGNEVNSENDYTFIRTDWLGRHLISIEHKKSQFFWTIGVQHEGNFWQQNNGVKITGYYHVATNGNLADLQKALNATQQFFPRPELADRNYSPFTAK